MTKPIPQGQGASGGCAGAPPRHYALVIDSLPERMIEICREVEKAPGIGLRGAITDAGLGIVSAARHAPDCVLLGWDGAAIVTADIALMLHRVRASLKVVVVTSSEEESARARNSVSHACASLIVRDLARRLPDILAMGSPAA